MTKYTPPSKRCKSRAERKHFNARRPNIVASNMARVIEEYMRLPPGEGNFYKVAFSVGLARACLKHYEIARGQRRRLRRALHWYDHDMPVRDAARRLLAKPYEIIGFDWGTAEINGEQFWVGPDFGVSIGGQARIDPASVASRIDKELQKQGVDARVAVSPASYGTLTLTAQIKVDKPADFIQFLCGPGDLHEPQAQ